MAQSLISRNNSQALKGFLILLIVFAHCTLLTYNPETGSKRFFFHYFYSFHVSCFLILPALYGYSRKQGTGISNVRRDLLKYFIRFYVPYLWTSILCFIVFAVINLGNGNVSVWNALKGIIIGQNSLLSSTIGFHFPWFLPAMAATMLWHSIWNNITNRIYKVIFFAVAFSYWPIWYFAGRDFMDSVSVSVPFSLFQGLGFFSLGLVARYIILAIKDKGKSARITVYAIFIIFSILYYLYRKDVIFIPSVLCVFAMPLSAICCFFYLSDYMGRSRVLLFIGQYTFPIYVFHIFIIYAIIAFLAKFGIGYGIFSGLGVALASFAISLGISVLIYRIPTIRNVLFPEVGGSN